MKLTDKQLEYIELLMESASLDDSEKAWYVQEVTDFRTDNINELTKGEASDLIDVLKGFLGWD